MSAPTDEHDSAHDTGPDSGPDSGAGANVAARTLGARRIDYLPLEEVTPAERNVKLHDESGIRASIAHFGYVEPLVLDERTHRLVAGHGRLEQLNGLRAKAGKTGRAKGGPPDGVVVDAEGRWLVPVVRGWSSADDAAAQAYLIASNRLTERGGWDETALADVLADLDQADVDLPRLAGFADVDVAALLQRLEQGSPTPSPRATKLRVDEVPLAPAIPLSRPGELIELGPHRLLVGHAGDPANLRTVMGAHKASAWWSDLPTAVPTDAPAGQDLPDYLHQVLDALAGARVLQSGAAFYLAHQPGPISADVTSSLRSDTWHLQQILVWVKDSALPGRGDHAVRHQLIAYGRYDVRKDTPTRQRGRSGPWYAGTTRTGVFDVARPATVRHQPATVPLDLISAQLSDVTRRGQHVLDVFAGAGATLLAAHSLGLIAHLTEPDPALADVIAARYQHLTGDLPLVDGLRREYPLQISRDDDAAEVVATVEDLRGDVRGDLWEGEREED